MKNETKITLISGDGGDGCVSFREKNLFLEAALMEVMEVMEVI